jgi:glycosyltransferase involved in cell wall biosynthesis
MDGGSTDGSRELIQRHASSLAYWESAPDRGIGHALNKGFARSTGEIMGWLNADDVLMPGSLAIIGQIFADYPQIDWLTSGSVNITDDDRLFIVQNSRKHLSQWTQLFLHSPPPQQCTFWRRRLWEQAGGCVVETTRYVDCELWLRFHEHARPYLADTLFGAWRLHSGSHSTQRLRELHREIAETNQIYLSNADRWRQNWLRLAWPFLVAYFQGIDRGVLSRVHFELWDRRKYLLTYSLRTGRFRLQDSAGWLPRPWPLTIDLDQPDIGEYGTLKVRS